MTKRKDPETGKHEVLVARRDLLRGAIVLVAVPGAGALSGCSDDDDSKGETLDGAKVFAHGVASGDPVPDGVILWTRVTLDGSPASVDVAWEVADDPEMTKRVASGSFSTNADRDYTVKVDARGLSAGRTYYYRFTTHGARSRVGRTRTAPQGAIDRLRFGVVSCASMAHGYFHAYRGIAQRTDLDAVLHLGDYIYEYGSGTYGNLREYEPAHEITTLDDYRKRHAQYKREEDLKEAHRQHPFITIWDDHEVANDAYKDGAENHDPATEGSYSDRKAAAQRAYREWMPIREQSDGRIFRKLTFGDLAELVLLDTRHWARSKQASAEGFGPAPAPQADRTLLGDDQAAWLEDSLRTSTARWKLVGQQVMVGNLSLGSGQLANFDQWHGYPESRKRLLTFFKDSGVKNVVVLTGDIHSSWANDIIFDPDDTAAYDPATGRGSLAVELVAPAVSSPGIPEQFVPFLTSAKPKNPHVHWFEPQKRGFMIVDVTAERTQGAWFLLEDITQPSPAALASFAKAWSVKDGAPTLVEDASAAPDRSGAPPAAP